MSEHPDPNGVVAVGDLPRYLQLLWGREPAGRRGPRPTLTITELGAAGVAIADAEGLDAVSMKRVAESVGFTTMSLYRYVASKEELLAVMYDVAVGLPSLATGRTGRTGWRRRLEAWARALTTVRLDHPWLVEVVATSPPLTPNVLAWTEAGLAALDSSGLGTQDKFSVLLALDGWASQHVRQSIQMGLIGRGAPESGDYAVGIASLVDSSRFPHLASAAPEAIDDADEDFFEAEFGRGLALLLDGVAARIEGVPGSPG